MSTEDQFCTHVSKTIEAYYKKNISGYVDIPICLIGVFLNLFNILVFSRKNMISSANLILAHLAFVDMLDLIAYIWYSWISFSHYPHFEGKWDFEQAIVHLGCYNFVITFHFISVFLTMMLAIWRYIAVVHPFKESQWCNMKTTRNAVKASYILCILLSVPMYLSRDIKNQNTNNQTLTKLIIVLWTRKEHRKHPVATSSTHSNKRSLRSKRKQQLDRSVVIMLALVALFLVIKIPSGILNLMGSCYTGLGGIINTLANINISITFVVYYTMSRNFRITFKSLFNGNVLEKDMVFSTSNNATLH
ncbi:somatostatin receptor type 5-like [Planococcus citri]|uniref:somatostatin receptor type 5-like n=1 Tax=Planococcus citri TaxID=170843 RepID=UPI0031FA3278